MASAQIGWGGRLVLLGASLLFVLVLGEGAVRLVPRLGPPEPDHVFCTGPSERKQFHPLFGFVEIPGSRYLERRSRPDGWALHEHNDLGFRDVFDTGDQHVLVLGDSFTRGSLVDNPQTYPELLDRWRPDVAFHNFGIGGYGTAESLAVYRAMASRWDHDLVILGYYLGNDLEDNVHDAPTRPRFEVVEGRLRRDPRYPRRPTSAAQAGPLHRLHDLLQERLRLYALVNARTRALLGQMAREETAGFDVDRATRLTRALLDGLASDAAAQGARLLVVAIPSWNEVTGQGDRDRADLQRALLRDLEDGHANASLLDLRDAIHEAGPERIYGTVDKHFNARGYHLVAAAIHDWIEGEGPRVLRSGRPAPAFPGMPPPRNPICPPRSANG